MLHSSSAAFHSPHPASIISSSHQNPHTLNQQRIYLRTPAPDHLILTCTNTRAIQAHLTTNQCSTASFCRRGLRSDDNDRTTTTDSSETGKDSGDDQLSFSELMHSWGLPSNPVEVVTSCLMLFLMGIYVYGTYFGLEATRRRNIRRRNGN
jgi:hypothetical protein